MKKEIQLEAPIQRYNGEVTLQFDRANWHWYRVYPDGKLERQAGVTGVVGIIDKSTYLVPWGCKMMYLELLRKIPRTDDQHVVSISWDELTQILETAKTAHKRYFETAGDVGTAAHTWIEASIRNAMNFTGGVVEKMNEFAPTDDRAVNCGLAAFDWMKKHNVRWQTTERVVCSRQYGYAGTCDGTAIVDGCDDPKCCPLPFWDELDLIDWKSSNQLSVQYLYQTAAYQQAIQEETDEHIRARWILRLGKEKGDFESWYEREFEQDLQGYLTCLALSRAHKAVEQRMSEQKKLKTFRRREEKKEEKARIKFAKRTEMGII